jgi:hypothetical protein
MTALDTAKQVLLVGGLASEGLCALAFLVTGKVRNLPLVFSFIAYLFLSDASLILIAQHSDVWAALVITTYVGYLFEAAAVWELAWKLGGTVGKEEPSLKWRYAGIFAIFCALATALITDIHSYNDFGSTAQTFLNVDQAVSIFRVLVLLAILLFMRLEISGPKALPSRTILAFTTYAVCGSVKHALNELAPRMQFPSGTFAVSECVCGFVWVLLLLVLTWQLFRPVPESSDSAKSSEMLHCS